MAILKPDVPPAAAEAFSTQLAEFVWAAAGDQSRVMQQRYVGEMKVPTLADLQQAGGRTTLLHDAHRLYVLGLKDIANEAGIDAAKWTGWRFFAGNQPGKTLLGTVTQKDNNWRMTAGDYGDRVSEILAATNALGKLKELKGGQYELRVLSVPGLNLEAFWLANMATSGPDLVVPIPATPKQPTKAPAKLQVYSTAGFLAAIRPLARQRLAAGSKYGG